jgi:hypothetical protein
MAYQFNPFTGQLDASGGGNPFDQELNTSNLPTFNAVFLNDPNGNPDQTTTVSALGIGNSASSDSSFSLNANGIGFQVADTSTAFTAGQIAYTPSGGTQKTYALPPGSGTLATTESITFPVISVNGNTGAVVLDIATFVPPAWINIVNNATDLDVPQITAGYWFLQSGTYGTTTAVYVPNGSSDSHLKVYYSTTDNLWHIVATGGGGDYPEYTTSNSSGYPANFTITGVSNTDGNTYTRSITFTHGNTVITPTSILSAGTSRYASRLDHTHPVPSASSISNGTLDAARLPATAVTTTGTQTLTNKSISSSQITGLATIATTGSASDLSTGTIDNARLPTSFTSTNLTAPNQTSASGSSILTRDLGDARYGIIAKKSTADIASTTTTLADVTGLTGFTLEANTMYRFEFAGRHTASSGGSHYLVLSSTAAIANASATGFYIIFGSRTDAGFSNPSGNLYAFINRSSTGNTNNPSAAQYYILTGSTAPTMKVQFSQTGSAFGTSTLLSGAVASFTKLV